MAARIVNLPTPDQLRELLHYDPETGKLFWKERPASMFKDGYFSRQANCNRWNVRYAGKVAMDTKKSDGYKHGTLHGAQISAHRVAWAIHYGAWPVEFIDHKNGVKADNRIENLREASHTENNHNARAMTTNRSGVKGVNWDKVNKKWKVAVMANGKRHHIGRFLSLDDAAAARRSAAEVLHGEFACHG